MLSLSKQGTTTSIVPITIINLLPLVTQITSKNSTQDSQATATS